MSVLGWILAAFGAALTVFGIRMSIKGRRIAGVPFRRPSEIMQQGPQVADPRGMISTEGHVSLPPQPLIAPMSGQPCLAFEIVVERKWEKQVQTQKGVERKSGTDRVFSDRRGSLFQLGDGAGAVLVDASTDCDVELEKVHASTVQVGAMIPGALQFGHLQLPTPQFDSTSSRTLAFVGTERALKPAPTLYALGQLTPGPHGLAIACPKGVGTGKLLLSARGHDALVGKTRTHMLLGFVLGGLLVVGGLLLGLLGSKPKTESGPAGSPADTANALEAEPAARAPRGLIDESPDAAGPARGGARTKKPAPGR